MTETKQRKPGQWVVLKEIVPSPELGGQPKQAGATCFELLNESVIAKSAKEAIAQMDPARPPQVEYVAISERNWRPYTAEVPPTPQAVLRPVKVSE